MNSEERQRELKRIKELTILLNTYRDEYYNNSESKVSDYEYDSLYDELAELEKETDFFFCNSPTHNVGYEVKSELEKVKHSHPMLSLGKTKSVDDLVKFSSGKDCIVSLKLDGLTILNTYDNGSLVQSETRGNGEEGEIVTHNARVFDNLPNNIPFDRKFEIEGEAIITYSDFEKINAKLPEDDRFANPRNLASGSVRQFDSKITKDRHVRFVAWKVPFGVTAFSLGFEIAESYGFEVVPYKKYNSNKDDINEIIEELKNIAKEKSIPIDGLVITYDNVEYGKSLGMTGHHPKHSLAYKFSEDKEFTTLREVEWSMSKNSINPVAIFDTVELAGTEVSRASLSNISIMKELNIKIGSQVEVCKRNEIIPYIESCDGNGTDVEIPTKCPVCHALTEIITSENGTQTLICTNPDCKGKLLGKLTHAVSKNALNIDGLSESTLEKFINLGWISSIKDIYHLNLYKNHMIVLDGFGKKSIDKLLESIEKSRNTNLERFLYSLSIPLLGKSASKMISEAVDYDFDIFIGEMTIKGAEYFRYLPGIGDSLINSLNNYWKNHYSDILQLSEEFVFKKSKLILDEIPKTLQNKTFVVTGSVHHYKNRDELKADIVAHGGIVVSSVSSKTSYLINNDINSTSSKNQKAKSFNIPIISEEEFLQMIK